MGWGIEWGCLLFGLFMIFIQGDRNFTGGSQEQETQISLATRNSTMS